MTSSQRERETWWLEWLRLRRSELNEVILEERAARDVMPEQARRLEAEREVEDWYYYPEGRDGLFDISSLNERRLERIMAFIYFLEDRLK